MRATYRDIAGLLERRAPFTGNSMSAHYDGEVYVVMSYRTVIAKADHRGHWVTREDYSVTTSRHKNLCRAYLPGEFVPRETFEEVAA